MCTAPTRNVRWSSDRRRRELIAAAFGNQGARDLTTLTRRCSKRHWLGVAQSTSRQLHGARRCRSYPRDVGSNGPRIKRATSSHVCAHMRDSRTFERRNVRKSSASTLRDSRRQSTPDSTIDIYFGVFHPTD